MIYNEFPDATSTKKYFDGIIIMTKLNGDFIRAYRLKANEYVHELAASKKSKADKNKAPNNGNERGIELDEVIVTNSYKNSSTFVSLNEMGKEVPISVSWDSMGGGGMSPSEEPNPLKIYNFLEGKPRCINDLLDSDGNSFVQNLLANFEGDGSEFDIKIISQDVIISEKTQTEINGSTTRPIDKLIVIKISTSKANLNPNLVVARTILHEYIHADLYRKLPILNNSTTGMPDFQKTYETYNEIYHHNNMADLYLVSMTQALKEFHKTQLTNDYDIYKEYYGEPTDAFYEAVAWGGLKEHNVDAWTKLPEDKKMEINSLSGRIMMLGKISPCAN
jgi:hypothetical protein